LKWIKPKEDEVKTVVVGGELYEKDSVLQVKKDIKVGEKISLKNINFEKGYALITPESFVELNKLVQYMFRHPSMEIRINGHSDNTGSTYRCQKISEQRARAVFEYLIGKGVQNKMYFIGFGNKLPIAGNDTEEGKAKNRRVEIEIIKE
jgi:OOP family OmpA-OmpF porin